MNAVEILIYLLLLLLFQSSLAGISLELERHENLPVRIEVIVR